jgi:two-component system, sensor histidine kinase RegB
MTAISPAPQLSITRPAHPLRVGTLVRLRWLAVAGQASTVLGVHFGLGFELPILACLSLIGLSILLNVGLLIRFGPAYRPSSRLAALQLAYDSLQLGGLLFLTGGLGNPFALLLLAPVSVSASTLPARETMLLAALVALVATLLAVFHLPLPWEGDRQFVPPQIYLLGMWISLLCGVAFISSYTNRVAHEARQLVDALTATELALSRQQHLSALDGLAAAAAHELGTPLATIALAAKEMRREVPDGELADDMDLILEQIARCRAILGKLRSLRPGGSDIFDAVSVGDLLAELAKPHEGHGKTITITKERYGGPEPVIPRNVALLYGLGNIIENAVQFARQTVTIKAGWDPKQVSITVADDGPGFPTELLSRLGEPYLTTKSRDRGEGDMRNPDGPGGLGLGVFIAKTLLERSGARLRFFNARVGGHASVEITWQRAALSLAETEHEN